MRKQKNGFILKVLASFVLFALLVLPMQLAAEKVQAAEKPAISNKMTIGRGSTYSADTALDMSNYYTLEVYNPVKKATYSFTSSNKSVVTVKSKGIKGYLTGVKTGTATITCQQKLNGKTTKVGTCKVTVKAPEIYSESYDGLPLGTGETCLVYYSYRNNSATYTFTSNSKDFTMKEKVTKLEGATDFYIISQTYTAKKAGTYTVTVKETYNKVTTTVAKIKYTVVKATVGEERSIYLGEPTWAFYLVNHSRGDVDYLFYTEDEEIVEFYLEEDTVYFRGLKVGTTTIKIYEDVAEPDESKLIGSCEITVKDYTLESIDPYFYATETYVDNEAIGVDVYKNPYGATDTITVTSSDPNVATVSEVNEYNYFEITPVSKGTVTITITCGAFTETETITVYADSDEMYGY